IRMCCTWARLPTGEYRSSRCIRANNWPIGLPHMRHNEVKVRLRLRAADSRTHFQGRIHMPFTVPPLPYAFDALEPHIDKMTMEIHHDKHHGAYVTNLNKALESAPNLAGKTVEELLANNCAIVPENIKTAVRNNGGGHINHSMFWTIIGPKAGGEPVGKLAAAINSTFGSFATFKEKFGTAATTRFGSGWAWVIKDSGKIDV